MTSQHPVVYARNPAVFETESNDELVVGDEATANWLVLKGTAVVIWRLLIDGPTAEQIVDSIMSDYQGDRNAITQDVQQTLDFLVSHGVVVERTERR